MTFTLEINTDNAAFGVTNAERNAELARLLRIVAHRLDGSDARDEGHATGYEQAEAEGEPYRGAWEDFFNAWHDGYATGRWPGAGPEDEHLRSVMLGDFERGADALAILRDLHEAPELDCLPDTLRRRIETLLAVE